MNEWKKEQKCSYLFRYIKQMEMKESLSFCQGCLWTLFHEASEKAFCVRGQQAGLHPSATQGGGNSFSANGYPRPPRRWELDGNHGSLTTMMKEHHPQLINTPELAPEWEHRWKPKQHCPPRWSGFMGLGRTFWKYHLKQLLSLLSTCLPTACLPSITLRWWKSRRTAHLLKNLIRTCDSRLTIYQQSQEKWYCERLKTYRRCDDILITNFMFL